MRRHTALRISKRSSGFTLAEVVTTVLIIGILAGIAVPNFSRVIERSYRREALDILHTIYAGEKVYFVKKDRYLTIASAADWNQIFMDDPHVASIPVTFTVAADATTFTATAKRNPVGSGKTMTIDQNRKICGGPSDDSCSSWPK